MQMFVDSLITTLEALRINSGLANPELVKYFLFICGFTVVIYLGFYVLKAVAVCKLAKKRSIKYWWLGIIPFANFAVIGKLAGPVRVFRVDVKNIGIITACAAFVMYATSAFFVVSVYGDYVVRLLSDTLPVGGYQFTISDALGSVLTIMNYVVYVIELIYIFSYIGLVFSFFKKYAPAKALIFSVLSIIEPLFSVFLLVVRNNKPQSYDEYIKEQYAKRYGQSYNPYSNPYSTKDNPYENAQGGENPFDEFADNSASSGTNNNNNNSGNSSANPNNADPFDEYNQNGKH